MARLASLAARAQARLAAHDCALRGDLDWPPLRPFALKYFFKFMDREYAMDAGAVHYKQALIVGMETL